MHRGNGLYIESSLKRRKAAAAVVGRADLTTRARPEEKVAAFIDIPPSARGSHRIARCAIKATPAWHPTARACGDPLPRLSPPQQVVPGTPNQEGNIPSYGGRINKAELLWQKQNMQT